MHLDDFIDACNVYYSDNEGKESTLDPGIGQLCVDCGCDSFMGTGLNREYCPTYYKYPDYIIKEVLLWQEIEFLFGEFDIFKKGYAAYGGYYAYTDEQGNAWYYTIHFLEGEVVDIRMEIH